MKQPSLRTLFTRRRAVFGVGTLAFLSGLFVLVVGAWSALDNEPGREPPPLVDLGSEAEAARVLPSPVTASATLQPTATPQSGPPLGDAGYRMAIESIGVEAGVYTYGLDENAIPQVPTNPWEVAWYNFSSQPGTGSNAVFAGHVTWNGPAVFYDLQALQPGDIVRLLGANGVELTYRVSDNFSVDPNDPDSLKVMQATEQDVITLITCGGTFFETDDPVSGGDYTLRVIGRAERVS
ncbi:MAG TPA: class F sortase [Dehalococcoidia bacterium]|nr:class F sortase [Dehalococcoidia bacterium]